MTAECKITQKEKGLLRLTRCNPIKKLLWKQSCVQILLSTPLKHKHLKLTSRN